MKNILTVTTFLILAVANAQQITSTFDTDVDGWLISGDATSAIPNFIAEGGNPGGYASADDTAAGGVWVWSAPEKFLGNQSESFGKELSFDLKQSSLDSQFDDSDIIITGNGITIIFDLASNPGLDWTHYSVRFNTTNLWKINNLFGEPATDAQILSVLSNISSLKIRGEYVSGSDTGGIDNVILQTGILAVNSFDPSTLKCYPNPASDRIYFSEQVSDVSIYDLLGKKINLKMQQQSVDVSQLPKGIYTVKIHSANQTQTKKIIKE